jgi:hypothetical protein
MANREPRDIQTREKTARYDYKPASSLPDPSPEPGYKFRWIATHINGQPIPQNVARAMREHWVPVKAVDHPELMLEGTKDGNVEIGGLMLCKAPDEAVESRTAYYANQAERQMESVDNSLMRQSDARMPIFKESSSETRFGKGSK